MNMQEVLNRTIQFSTGHFLPSSLLCNGLTRTQCRVTAMLTAIVPS